MLDNTDVCLEQVKRGMAWHYKQYANEQTEQDQEKYAQAEKKAQAESIGIGKDKSPTPPWDFRKKANQK